MAEPSSRLGVILVAGALVLVLIAAMGIGWYLKRDDDAHRYETGTNAESEGDVSASTYPDDDPIARERAGQRGWDARGSARKIGSGANTRGVVRDASAGVALPGSDDDGGAASFARRRAAFVVAVNEMLATLPDTRRFSGREPDIAWQRGFGHTLRVNDALTRSCFLQSSARAGDRGGMLGYEVAVGPDGRVTDVAITSDPIGDPTFAACLVDALRGMTFPESAIPLSMQAGLVVGGARYRGARPPRASSAPDDGVVFVHAMRGLGPMPE